MGEGMKRAFAAAKATRLPPKRKPAKSGIERASHIRTAANAGTGIKPHDSSAVPMCHAHHLLYHERGHDTFTSWFQLDLAAMAEKFTSMSPDKAMRDSRREEGRE